MAGPNGHLSRYLARRWCTIPVHRPDPENATCSCGKSDCHKPGKHPVGRFWPKGSTNPNDFENRNIGVRVGPESDNLADVDSDCREAVTVSPLLLPATDSVFGRGGEATHQLYTVPGRDAAYLKLHDPVLEGEAAVIVELRWPQWDEDEERYANLQTVFPPSLHFSGSTVEWIRDGPPAEVAGTELVAAVHHVGAAVLLARYAKPKERHELVLLLANLLVRAGWEDDAKIVLFIVAVFTAKNDPEKAKKVHEGEGLNAVKDARKRLKSGKPMKGLPVLKDMLDSALDNHAADKVITNIRDWMGLPDTPGPAAGARPSDGAPSVFVRPPIPPYTPFPVHLLPKTPRDYVTAIAAAMNCDPSYSALPALAALGTAIGASHAATPKKRWKEPPYVWALAVGKSGAIKSPPYRDVEDMAEDINDTLETEHSAEMAAYEDALELWEEAKHDSEDGGTDPGPRPKKPVKRAFIKGDVTIEALVGKLQENPRGLLIGQDELSAWIGSFVKYAGKTGVSDLPRWLQLHHAGTVNYTRKTGDPDKREVRVRGVGVSVTGTIQPKVLSRVLTEEFRASGFLARLLLALPPWRKRQWTEAEIDEPTRQAFADLLAELYRMPAGAWPNGKPAPHLVRLSEQAKALFVSFYNANGEALETADEDMCAVMSKLEGYALRFALIFHCCRLKEYSKEAAITVEDMTAAIELTKWFRDEAERVYLALAEPPEVQSARHLAEVIRKLAAKYHGKVTPRNLQRFNCRKYPTSEAAEAVLERLVGLGFGRWELATTGEKGGASTRGYVPCMTHDTTEPGERSGPPGEEDEDGGLHDTTPDEDNPPPSGSGPAGDETAEVFKSCDDAAEPDAEVVSDVSCVMHDREEPEAGFEDSLREGGRLCHAKGVVSCTGPELVREPDRLTGVVQAVRASAIPVGLDLETTGLSHSRDRVRLLSLATPGGTFLIDLFAFSEPVRALAPLFGALSAVEVVGHNLGFDLPFLMKLGFVPGRVRDTMLASQVLHAGNRTICHSLKELTHRHLGVILDKEMQTADWSGALAEAHLEYAARDAELPLALWEKLTTEIAAANLTATVDTEMAALPTVAWAATKGVGFDRTAWEAVADDAEARAGALRERLDELVPNAGNLFGVTNWNSPEEVAAAFGALGIALDSTDDDALAALDHPAAPVLREYRAASKLSSSYGREWLRHLSPDGRVYATWKQIGAGASGRMSCKEPNLQQLPRDPRYRRCFVAPPGRVLVKADYSQIELRIAAKITGDRRMLDAYERGEDLHATTARTVLGKGEPSKADRQIAKSCFSGDTEVLTPGGWVQFDQYDGSIPVAQYVLPTGLVYNPPRGHGNRWGCTTGKVSWDGAGGVVEFVRPLGFRSFEDRAVWHQQDRNTDLLVTGDHDIVYIDNNRRPRKQPLEAVAPGNARYLVAAGTMARQPSLSEPLTRVLAMVVADGSFRGGPAIRLGFSKCRKVERCRQLLQTAGISYRETTSEAQAGGVAVAVTTFVIADRRLRELLLRYVTDRKDLSWSCLTELDGAVYLEEASYWDSHRMPAASRVRSLFSTTRKQTADVMQAMACTSGIGSVLRFTPRAERHHSDLWDLSYPLGAAPRWRASWNPQPAGRMTVYCVQVPSGAILVRRHGRVVVAGNCNFGLLYGMGAKSLAAYAASNFGVSLTEGEASRHRDAFFRSYPGLGAWHRAVPNGVVQTRTLAGRRRLGVSAFTEKLNTPTQGTGADGLKRALALLWERRAACPDAFPVLFVHDEIVVECDEAKQNEAAAWVRDAMRDGMAPLIDPVPVEVEVSAGRSWGG